MAPQRMRRPRTRRPAHRRLEPGVTLVEVLIVSVITAIVLGAVTMGLTETGSRVWSQTDGQLTTLSGTQVALDRLSQDLRIARQPVTCRADGSLSFTKLVRDPTTQQLVAGPFVTYACVGCSSTAPGTLTKVEDSASPQVVADGLTSFTGICLSGGLVKVTLTSQVSTRRGPFAHTLESQVWVRNPGVS